MQNETYFELIFSSGKISSVIHLYIILISYNVNCKVECIVITVLPTLGDRCDSHKIFIVQ